MPQETQVDFFLLLAASLAWHDDCLFLGLAGNATNKRVGGQHRLRRQRHHIKITDSCNGIPDNMHPVASLVNFNYDGTARVEEGVAGKFEMRTTVGRHPLLIDPPRSFCLHADDRQWRHQLRKLRKDKAKPQLCQSGRRERKAKRFPFD